MRVVAVAVSLSFLSLCCFASDWSVDGVYLLDVTNSMIGYCASGECPENAHNLETAVSLLASEIKNYEGGHFILTVFAGNPSALSSCTGPVDLDGDGPLQSTYDLHISSDPNDPKRMWLLSLLDPDTYLPEGEEFTDEDDSPYPSGKWGEWRGVVAAVRDSGRGGKTTDIYDNLDAALDKLEELELEGGVEYAETHVQRIVLITDGENVCSEVSKEKIEQRLAARDSDVFQSGFLLTKYCLGQECGQPPDDVHGDGRAIYRINLDRQGFRFPGNAWFDTTLDLDGITIPSITIGTTRSGVESVVDWGQAVLDVARRSLTVVGAAGNLAPLRDVGASLTPPRLNPSGGIRPGTKFDLQVTLSPREALRDAIRAAGSVEGTIVGNLSLTYEPQESEGRYVGFANSAPRFTVRFERPNVLVSLRDTVDGFDLVLTPNPAFRTWAADEGKNESVVVDFDRGLFRCADLNGNEHSGSIGCTALTAETVLHLSPRAAEPGTSVGEFRVRCTAAAGAALFNGAADWGSGRVSVSLIGLDGPDFRVSENLWDPPLAHVPGVAVIAHIKLIGTPEDWDAARLGVVPVGFPCRVQATLNPDRQGTVTVKLDFPDVSELGPRRTTDPTPAGYLQLSYSRADGAPHRLVAFLIPKPPVYLTNEKRLVHVAPSKQLSRACSGDEVEADTGVVATLTLSAEDPNVGAQYQAVTLSLPDDNHFVLALVGSDATAEEMVRRAGDGVEIKVAPHTAVGERRGALEVTAAEGAYVQVGDSSSVVRSARIEWCVTLVRTSHVFVDPTPLALANPWVASDTPAGWRMVESTGNITFLPPTSGRLAEAGALQVTVAPGSTGLPDRLIAVETPKEISPPFVGVKGPVQLTLDLAEMRRSIDVGRESISGELEVSYKGPEKVRFENPDGGLSETARVPFTIDVRRPWIRVAPVVSQVDQALRRGDLLLEFGVEYAPWIPVRAGLLEVDCTCPGILVAFSDDNTRVRLTIAEKGPLGAVSGEITFRCANPDIAVPEASWGLLYKRHGWVKWVSDHPSVDGTRVARGGKLATWTITAGLDFELVPAPDRRLQVVEHGSHGEVLTGADTRLAIADASGNLYRGGGFLPLTPTVLGEPLKIVPAPGTALGKHEGTLALSSLKDSTLRIEDFRMEFRFTHTSIPGMVMACAGRGAVLLAAGLILVGTAFLLWLSVSHRTPPLRTLAKLLRGPHASRLQRVGLVCLGLLICGAVLWCVGVFAFGG